MPTYRNTPRGSRRGADGNSRRQQAENLHVFETYEVPQKSKTPVLVAVVIVLAIIIAFIAVFKFAFGGEDRAKIASDAEPMSATTFSEALPDETITVAENVVMTMAGDRDTYVLVGEEYLEAGCRATDPLAGNISDSIEIESDVNTKIPGDYQVTYTATTEDGSVAKATRNVHVVNSFDAVAKDIPVLMYHYVYDNDYVPEDLNGNYILNTKLAEQCAYLQENDYYYPSFEELRAWVDGEHTLPAKSVVLTFDDGTYHFLDFGIPVLEEYEVPATSFLIAGDDDAIDKTIAYANPYVQFESHSYNMHRAGGGAGQGGIIHALSRQEIYDDALAVNEILGGNGAVAMAYPFGDNNATAWDALDEAGILCAFTVKNDRIRPGDNPMALNRVRISGEYDLGSFISLVKPSA